MKNQPDRLLARDKALAAFYDGVRRAQERQASDDWTITRTTRTPVALPADVVAHRRHQSMIVMAVSDSAFTFRPRLCNCNALRGKTRGWPHVQGLSQRCQGIGNGH